jgi:chromosomal replication initiator protein
MSSPTKLWDGVVCRLGAELPAFALEAWLRPLVAELRGDALRLACPTAFHRDRVRERFLPAIRRAASAEAGAELDVELVLAQESPRRRADAAPAPARAVDSAGRVGDAEPRAGRAPAPRPAGRRAQQYGFDDFVVGPCNALAREAALAVAHDRQQGVDPLFLTSARGLGKTHLAQSIVQEARRSRAGRVLYGSAEGFIGQFTAAIRGRQMEDFKRRFRERCDLLVLEDVQLLSAKAATQLELFHTISHLLDVGARVVLTADRLPRDIAGLDARLASQMASGLVAALEPPDLCVRRRILAGKAARGGVRVPDACLDLLAESVRGSVRDLEGVLIQLVATASLLDRPVDLELTRAALHKLEAPREARPRLRPEAVIAVVAAFFQTTPAALASRSRRRDVLVPRQLAMFLCRRFTDLPLGAIARAFGREHPAVANAVRAVERRMLERAPLRYQVEALSARLGALAPAAESGGAREPGPEPA